MKHDLRFHDLRFLSVEDVLLLHADTITHEGGSAGIRDPGLLEAAVLMPQQQWEGEYLHDSPAAMAAAYLFHLASNHPFVDGNKRAAVLAALVFLDANEPTTNEGAALPDPEDLERITMAVAGFGENELSIESRENALTVKGEKNADEQKDAEVLYRGIAGRSFERRFQLADHVEVKGASLVNGLLHVDLVREIPEAMKPRTIAINSGKASNVNVERQIEAKAA